MRTNSNYLKRLFVVVSLAFFPAIGYSQLTSVEATLYIDSAQIQFNDTISFPGTKFFAIVTPDDLSDLGKISAVVYYVIDGSVVCDEIVKTKEDLINENLIDGDSFTLELCQYMEGYDYHIVISPETLTGAFVEIWEADYPL